MPPKRYLAALAKAPSSASVRSSSPRRRHSWRRIATSWRGTRRRSGPAIPPKAPALYARAGWTLPKRIDRVYVPAGARLARFPAERISLRSWKPRARRQLPFVHDPSYVSPKEQQRRRRDWRRIDSEGGKVRALLSNSPGDRRRSILPSSRACSPAPALPCPGSRPARSTIPDFSDHRGQISVQAGTPFAGGRGCRYGRAVGEGAPGWPKANPDRDYRHCGLAEKVVIAAAQRCRYRPSEASRTARP